MLLRNDFTRTCRSVIARFWGHQKAHLVLNFLYFSNLSFPKVKGSIFSTRSESEALYLSKRAPSKNWWFRVMCHNPYSPKILRTANIIDTFRYSDSFFTATTHLISTIKVSIEDPVHF